MSPFCFLANLKLLFLFHTYLSYSPTLAVIETWLS